MTFTWIYHSCGCSWKKQNIEKTIYLLGYNNIYLVYPISYIHRIRTPEVWIWGPPWQVSTPWLLSGTTFEWNCTGKNVMPATSPRGYHIDSRKWLMGIQYSTCYPPVTELLNMAIIYSELSDEKWWFAIVMLVYRRVDQMISEHPLQTSGCQRVNWAWLHCHRPLSVKKFCKSSDLPLPPRR